MNPTIISACAPKWFDSQQKDNHPSGAANLSVAGQFEYLRFSKSFHDRQNRVEFLLIMDTRGHKSQAVTQTKVTSMDFSTLLSFIFIASLLVMSPGPNGLLIAKTVPTSGKAAGFANVAGFVAAFYIHGAMSILGISLILVQSAQAFFIVKMLGAAYLCWIGFKALRDAWNGLPPAQDITPAKKQRTLHKAFVEGFLTNALNPKVSMFYLAAFPQFISQSHGALGASFTLVFAHSMLNLIWFSAIILLFSRLTETTRSGSFQRWLKGVTGVVFIGFGIKLATLKP